MALERKPVQDHEDPGYPSSAEYVTGRRAFIGLLGLTALGVGGVYMLKNRATATVPGGNVPQAPTGGIEAPVVSQQVAPTGTPPVPAQPQAVPQAAIRGEAGPPERPDPPVVQPQTAIKGDVRVPAQPQAVIEGEAIAPEVSPPALSPNTAPQAAVPEAPTLGSVPVTQAPVQPSAQPAANIRGRVRMVDLPESGAAETPLQGQPAEAP